MNRAAGLRVACLGGLLAAVLSACDSGSAAQPDAAPPQHQFPPVSRPLDVTAVVDRPCDLLRPDQVTQYGIDQPARQLPGVLGRPDCEWRGGVGRVWIYLSTSPDTVTLDDVYAQRGRLAQFEITTIAGYPATASRIDPALPACDVDVKVAQRQSITVSYDSTEYNQDPEHGCVVGKSVAEQVVRNLRDGG